MRPKLVFIATPDFAAELLGHILSHDLAEVVAAYTRPARPSGRGREIKERLIQVICRAHQIPLHAPEKLSTPDECTRLAGYAPDLAFVAAFGEIIKPMFYQIPRYGTFNLHYSLLPAFRGASPVQSALLAGVPRTGVTIQRIVDTMDAGDIALQRSFATGTLTADELFAQATVEAKALISEFLKGAPATCTTLIPQDETQATWCRKLEKNAGRITPHLGAEAARRLYAGCTTWPGAWFIAGGTRYVITSARLAPTAVPGTPGTVVAVGSKQLFLICTDGALEICSLKPEGKKSMEAAAFINGRREALPLVLES